MTPAEANSATFTMENATLKLIRDKDSMMRRAKLTLVGKFISTKIFQAHVVRSVLGEAWNLKKPDSIAMSMNDHNLFSFTFEHESEKEKVLDKRPWFVHNQLLVIKEYNPDVLPHKMDFSTSDFWVQVHAIPPVFLNAVNAKLIGERVGELLRTDFNVGGSNRWFRYLRMKVRVNITKPLFPGFYLE